MNEPPPPVPSLHPFARRVLGALDRPCRVPRGVRIVIGCSGGADSVALVRALAAGSKRRGGHGGKRMEPAVAHVQHHLRGEPAQRDAVWVERLAGNLDLPFLRADLDLSNRSGNQEAAARRERYAALASLAEAFEAPCIVTAHHGDDQLETLLMRLLRGTHVAGLRGIAWRRRLNDEATAFAPVVVRPMLATTHDQARNYLRDLGQDWREDETNREISRRRARLRRDVLPVLRELRPDVATRAVQLSGHFQQVHTLIEQQVDLWHERVQREEEDAPEGSAVTMIDREDARTMPAAVLSSLLRRLLIEAGVPRDRLSERALAPIRRAAREPGGGRRRFDLARGVRVRISPAGVRIA